MWREARRGRKDVDTETVDMRAMVGCKVLQGSCAQKTPRPCRIRPRSFLANGRREEEVERGFRLPLELDGTALLLGHEVVVESAVNRWWY